MVAALAMTMSRRQNSSCDQCRKGKRACDAVWLRDRQIQRTLEANAPKGSPALLSHGGLGPGPDDDFDLVGPCTNCARTNKHCTFEWVQSQQVQRRERLASSSVSTAPATKKGAAVGLGLDAQSADSQSSTPSSVPLRPLRPSLQSPAQYPFSAHEQQILMNSCSYPAPNPAEAFKMPTCNPVSGVAFVDGALNTNLASMSMPGTSSCLSLDTVATTAQPSSSAFMNVDVLGPYDLDPFGTGAAPPSGYERAPLDSAVSAVWSSPVAPSINSPTQMSNDDQQLGYQQMRKRRRTQSPARMSTVVQPTPLWDILEGTRLARSANGTMISETMMRIYHDVMEGALSCWLTEQTCPYNSLPSTPSSASTSPTGMSAPTGPGLNNNNNNAQPHLWGAFEDMQREWGANWSNRIYRRVIKLDRMAHLLGLKRLAPADERKVSSALNAAVMAFTAQWAQASQRSAARWPPDEDQEFRPPDLEEEFDRTLQKSFWNQARKSLSECNEIDSFRVVFAEIIFGLTQKYREDGASESRSMDHAERGAQSADATSEAVEEILREDTQQVWLERATRRLHVLRRRVEMYDRRLRNKKDSEPSAYDTECRKTIDLLFWLAVMFDTISAAMTERPLTVSDEDSSNLALTNSIYHTPVLSDPSKRWNVILAKDQQTKLNSLRWPCSDTDIAQELTDAAPVKVLLYRKVTLLQTLVARAVDPRAVEEAISDTLMVYSHWQAIYSAIFADCLAHHMLLSPRIQSWYVCLFGHWLLATLIVAELLEIVDGRGMGGEVEARRRSEEGTVAGIRRDTVKLVADLAKASTPQHDEVSGVGELDNFHHAVNEGALLTEPWTMILLRTFSKTALLFLEESENLAETSADRAGENKIRLDRCEDCIKALWYLGRKSDMAREVSQVLGVALQRARLKAGHGQ